MHEQYLQLLNIGPSDCRCNTLESLNTGLDSSHVSFDLAYTMQLSTLSLFDTAHVCMVTLVQRLGIFSSLQHLEPPSYCLSPLS
jgi:hypothetical protein